MQHFNPNFAGYYTPQANLYACSGPTRITYPGPQCPNSAGYNTYNSQDGREETDKQQQGGKLELLITRFEDLIREHSQLCRQSQEMKQAVENIASRLEIGIENLTENDRRMAQKLQETQDMVQVLNILHNDEETIKISEDKKSEQNNPDEGGESAANGKR
mmetsp:Transcript_29317/g.77014  ORF Transcript_29317/g.77014 Transcript_29317/m.77014 type:complete len:160 (+) Transcript_29317:125-604(+)